jgi:hypothetical protein
MIHCASSDTNHFPPDWLVLEAGSTGGEASVVYIAVGDRAGRRMFEMASAYELPGGQYATSTTSRRTK